MTRQVPPLLALAVLALAAVPVATSQSYRATGGAVVEVDGIERRFVAFEIADDGGTAATATWDTGAWIGDWWWIDLVFVEADVAELGWAAEGAPMLNLSFFVDPATRRPAADALRSPGAMLTEDSVAFWPFHEGLPDRVEVTIDAIDVAGDVMRVRGTVTAVLGLVADMDADEPDPATTITLRATFDLAEVARLVD